MGHIAIGGDVSKGRLDIAILNESFTRLHAGCYDDTPSGHQAVQAVLAGLRERYPTAVFQVGLESTGGLERNWLAFFRDERRWVKALQVHRLSPMQVKRHLSVELHRSVTDASAAEGIARYLLERLRDRPGRDTTPSPAVSFYRALRSAMHRQMEVAQQLQAVLIQIHPDLVQYCRSGIPDWIIAVVELFPTAADLGAADVNAVDAIRNVLPDRARRLVAAAQQSVAGLTGPAAGDLMRILIRQWRDLERTIADGKAGIGTLLESDPIHREQVRLMSTIPGIGMWTAQVLSLELGDLSRFHDDRALVAWCGLDPHDDRSGDGIIRRGISHRGNAQVRRALFMPALTAARHLPALAALDQRLRATGKRPLVVAVACMHKLLRIAFAVVRSGRTFDPQHEQRRAVMAGVQQAQRGLQTAPADGAQKRDDADLAAPVTAAEARKRLGRRNAAGRRSQDARSCLKSGMQPAGQQPQPTQTRQT